MQHASMDPCLGLPGLARVCLWCLAWLQAPDRHHLLNPEATWSTSLRSCHSKGPRAGGLDHRH